MTRQINELFGSEYRYIFKRFEFEKRFVSGDDASGIRGESTREKYAIARVFLKERKGDRCVRLDYQSARKKLAYERVRIKTDFFGLLSDFAIVQNAIEFVNRVGRETCDYAFLVEQMKKWREVFAPKKHRDENICVEHYPHS